MFVLSRCALQCWLAHLVKRKYFFELLDLYHLMNISCHRCCLYTTATGGALGYLEKTDSWRTAASVVTMHALLKDELSCLFQFTRGR